MKFSIILCTINRAALLEKGLHTLVNQEYDDEYEIIIVDDGSTDCTKEVVDEYRKKFSNITYIYRNKKEYGSPAQARNVGLKHAKYEYCCFTDPECLAPENMLTIHSNEHKHNDNIIICSIPEMLDIHDSTTVFVGFSYIRITEPKIKSNIKNWKDNHFSSFKKQHAISIGGVNEEFTSWGFEGIDFVQRMINSGLTLVNVGYVYHLYHEVNRDARRAAAQRIVHGVNNGRDY